MYCSAAYSHVPVIRGLPQTNGLAIDLNSYVQIGLVFCFEKEVEDVDAPQWSPEGSCRLVVAVAMVCGDVTEDDVNV